MKNLNSRQKAILEFIDKRQSVIGREIIDFIGTKFDKTSKPTVMRDLSVLLDQGKINQEGSGPSIKYITKVRNPLLKYFDPKKYFEKNPDERIIQNTFSWEIFDNLNNLFSKQELEKIHTLNASYQSNRKKLSQTILQKELERITIEFSWKSSQIEGNTYSLIDTEILLTQNKPASGHSEYETQMIKNHKFAIDYILENPKNFKNLSLQKIQNLQNILVDKLSIEKNIRSSPVGITGTNYNPIDNQHQIKEALEKLVKIINKTDEPIEKALIALLLISYIQPFDDGNKRTARILGNAILFAHNWCPLSYRSIDDAEYKKAILLFYEQNSANYCKELFIQQFEFAVNKYFVN